MILGNLNDTARLQSLGDDFTIALQWINDHIKETLTKGTIEIIPGKIHVNCEEVAMIPKEKQHIEAHRKYIDIHVPISGKEVIGWSAVRDLKNALQDYDEERDIIFYGDAPQCTIPVLPGQFAVMFPEDGHAPNIGTGIHRKFCVKILID